MKILYILIMCCHRINGKLSELERIEYCKTLQCDETVNKKVCGIRKENGRNTYMLFENECLLLKFGCQVDDDGAYGITNLQRCNEHSPQEINEKPCPNCLSVETKPVCGIRADGNGYRIRIFANKCKLDKYNCQQELQFNETNFYICVGNNNDTRRRSDETTNKYISQEPDNEVHKEIEIFNEIIDETTTVPSVHKETETFNKIDDETTTLSSIHEEIDIPNEIVDVTTTVASQEKKKKVYKNLVVIGSSMSDMLNINETVKNFFAATHVFDLPVRELPTNMNEKTRRMLIRVFGPIKVFTPWLKIPENITDDYYHKPTLSSCFHRCPKKCPDTYAPVCGVPGIVAREPSLMFQNHCFMDVAQCKMFWEDRSWTAQSSAYIESSFLFCLGDELNGLYRFLPLIRTLQHMGRLRDKGHFKYKLKNMRFFNQLLDRQPNLMG